MIRRFAAAAYAMAVIIGLAAALGTAGAWRLAQAPVAAEPLRALIEEEAKAVEGLELFIEDVTVAWNADAGRVEARIHGLRALKSDGFSVEAPMVALGFDPAALAHAQTIPSHIRVEGGFIQTPLADAATVTVDKAMDVDAAIDALFDSLDQHAAAALSAIDWIDIVDTNIAIEESVGLGLRIDRAVLRHRSAGIGFEAAGAAALRGRRIPFSTQALVSVAERSAAISIDAQDMALEDLAHAAPDIARLAHIEAPASLRVDALLDPQRRAAAALSVEIGEGRVATTDPGVAPLEIRGGVASIALADAIPVAELVETRGVGAPLDGRVSLDLSIPGVRPIPLFVEAARRADQDETQLRVMALDAPLPTLVNRMRALLIGFGVDAPDGAAPVEIRADGDVILDARLGADGGVSTAALTLQAGAGMLVAPAIYPDAPIGVDALSVRLTAEDGFRKAVLETAELQLTPAEAAPDDAPWIALRGTADRFEDGSASIALSVEGRALNIRHYQDLWPYQPQNTSREWMRTRMDGGSIPRLDGAFALSLNAEGEVALDKSFATFSVEGLGLLAATGLTPLRNLSGEGRLEGMTLTIEADNGEMRGARATGGTMVIPNLVADPMVIEIDANLEGPVADVLAVLDDPALGYPAKVGLSPKGARGSAAGRLQLAFPLVRDLEFDAVDLSAEAALVDMRLRDVVNDADLVGVDAILAVDLKGLSMTGSGRLRSSPIQFTWTEAFDDGPEARRITAKGRVDDETRAEIGLDALSGRVLGEIEADLLLTAGRDATTRIRADLGLDAAQLAIPELDWEKRPGPPAAASVDLAIADGELLRFSKIEASAPGLSFAGSYAPEGEEGGRVTATQARFGRTALNQLDVRFGPNAVNILARGPALDLAAFRDGEGDEEAPEEPGEPIDFAPDMPFALEGRIAVDRLWMAEDAPPLEAVDVRLAHSGVDWRRFGVAARAAGGDEIRMRYDPADPDQALAVLVGDVGAVWDALGLPSRISGGRLALNAKHTPEGGMIGRFDAEDVTLIEAPTMAKVLQIASLTGVLETLAGPGLTFGSIGANWRYGDGVLSLDRGVANNLSLGLTFNGDLNLQHETVAMRGTLAPVNVLNRVIGAIPLLGDLLSPRGEGLFAFSYQAQGPLDDPDVSANPLTALAPGMLRDLFPDAPLDDE